MIKWSNVLEIVLVVPLAQVFIHGASVLFHKLYFLNENVWMDGGFAFFSLLYLMETGRATRKMIQVRGF